jgi:L-alanine-DL-glutamate epimerase-like enolase superfamily enzyme
VHTVMPGAEFIFGLGVAGADPLTVDTGFAIQNGHVQVPTGAGLGVVVDEDAVKALTILEETVTTSPM